MVGGLRKREIIPDWLIRLPLGCPLHPAQLYSFRLKRQSQCIFNDGKFGRFCLDGRFMAEMAELLDIQHRNLLSASS